MNILSQSPQCVRSACSRLAIATLLAGLAAAGLSATPAFGAEKLRVLVLSGMNNHDWKSTTPEIVAALEESGHFRADVEENVPAMKPDVFARYDVVVSNANAFGRKGGESIWSPEMRAAFLAWIAKGHGLTVVHAGSSWWYEWPEFQALACATWRNGTNHARIHAAQVTFTGEQSPIVQDLKPFWTRDEFWQKCFVAPGAKALAQVVPHQEVGGSGVPEKIVFSTEVGGGRGVGLMLGHDVPAIKNPAFRTLLQRSVEWAATGKVTIPPAQAWPETEAQALAVVQGAKPTAQSAPTPADPYEALKIWRTGNNRTPLLTLEREAGNPGKRAELASKLAALLGKKEVSPEAKEFICKQLGLIGGEGQVPALISLLADEKLAPAAAGALEMNPTAAASKALLDAVATAAPALKIQIIGGLGRRGPALDPINPASPEREQIATRLTGLLGESDATVAITAAHALQYFPGETTVAALRKAAGLDNARLREMALQSLIRLVSCGKPDPALPAFIQTTTKNARLASAAFAASLEAAPEADAVVAALKGDDVVRREGALLFLRLHATSELGGKVSGHLAELPSAVLPATLFAFSERAVKPAGPAILNLAKSGTDAALQTAAIAALERTGSVEAIPFLLETAISKDAATKTAALGTLERLKAPGVDEALETALSKAAGDTQIVLITTVAQRQIHTVLPKLFEISRANEPKARRAAIGAIEKTASGSDLYLILDAMAKAEPSDISNWETALAAVAAGSEREQCAKVLTEALSTASAARTPALIAALASTASEEALRVLREKLRAPEEPVRRATLRALLRFQSPKVLPDLQAVAINDNAPVIRKVALRTLTDVIAATLKLPAGEALASVKAVVPVATDADDRRALLAALASVAAPEAADLAESIGAADPSVATEVQLTVDSINKRLHRTPKPKPTAKSAASSAHKK